MKCEQVWESSSALCSGELNSEEVKKIMAHTEECDNCRAWLGTMQNVWVMLDYWTVESAPKSCVASFRKQLAQINKENRKSRSWKFWETRQFTGPAVLVPGLAFLIIIGLLAAVVSVNQLQRKGTGQTTRVVAERRSNREGENFTDGDTASVTYKVNNEVDTEENLLPESLKHAGPLSLPSQQSVGVILVSDQAYRANAGRVRVSPDVLRVVPAGHTH